jgi:hypothetical protein
MHTCPRLGVVLGFRLERLADGRLLYRFKRPWRDGTTHVVYEPLELLEKLSALVPAPRAHLVRYYVEHRVMWSWSDKSVLPQSDALHLLHIKFSSLLVSAATFFLTFFLTKGE